MLSQSDKKNFDFRLNICKSTDKLQNFVYSYQPHFICHRHDNTPTAFEYTLGLMTCEKNTANMERMEEEIDSAEYRRYQHFLTNSKWDHQAVINKVQTQASEALAAQKKINKLPVGLLIDESSHVKKGIESVGVSRPAVCRVSWQGGQLPGWRLCFPVQLYFGNTCPRKDLFAGELDRRPPEM